MQSQIVLYFKGIDAVRDTADLSCALSGTAKNQANHCPVDDNSRENQFFFIIVSLLVPYSIQMLKYFLRGLDLTEISACAGFLFNRKAKEGGDQRPGGTYVWNLIQSAANLLQLFI